MADNRQTEPITESKEPPWLRMLRLELQTMERALVMFDHPEFEEYLAERFALATRQGEEPADETLPLLLERGWEALDWQQAGRVFQSKEFLRLLHTKLADECDDYPYWAAIKDREEQVDFQAVVLSEEETEEHDD